MTISICSSRAKHGGLCCCLRTGKEETGRSQGLLVPCLPYLVCPRPREEPWLNKEDRRKTLDVNIHVHSSASVPTHTCMHTHTRLYDLIGQLLATLYRLNNKFSSAHRRIANTCNMLLLETVFLMASVIWERQGT